MGKVWFFLVFPKFVPRLGGQPKKSILRLPTGPMGCSMPSLVDIHPVVWAPNPNKQTDRQTDRQASFIYMMGKGIPLHSEIIVKKTICILNCPLCRDPAAGHWTKFVLVLLRITVFSIFFPFCSYHLCLWFLILVFQLLELLRPQPLRDLFPCFVVDGAAGPAPVAQQRQQQQQQLQPSDLHIVPA